MGANSAAADMGSSWECTEHGPAKAVLCLIQPSLCGAERTSESSEVCTKLQTASKSVMAMAISGLWLSSFVVLQQAKISDLALPTT